MTWNESTLGDICDAGQGIIKTGPFGSQLHQSDYSDAGTPVVMPKDIVGGRVSESSIARVAEEHVERLSHHQLYPGDIVYGRRGDIGRCALVTPRESGWLCGTGCLRIHLGNGEVSPKFLFYFLNNPSTVDWIYNQAVGATMPNLNTSILRSIPVRYPTRETQERIAAILSAYDALIENNTRRIEILEEMARRLYEEWFVHFRFPGHEEVSFKESELGRIPEGWEQAQLRDICDVKSGYAFKSGSFCEDGTHHLVTIKNVQDGSFSPVCTNRLEEIPSNVPAHCFLTSGDILLSLTGNVGRVCRVHSGEFLLNQRVAKLVEKQADLKAFVYFTFRDVAFRKRLENLASGVAQQNLSPVKTSEIGIQLPPKNLLESFSELTGRNLELMVNLENKNANLRAQRDLLLPKLVSGEIDVSDIPMPDDKGVEAA